MSWLSIGTIPVERFAPEISFICEEKFEDIDQADSNLSREESIHAVSSVAEKVLKKRSCSSSDTDPMVDSESKRAKPNSISSLLCDSDVKEPALPEGFEFQYQDEISSSPSSSISTEKLPEISLKLVECLKEGHTFFTLGSYFRKEFHIDIQDLRSMWAKLRPQHYREVEETKSRAYDPFIVEELRNETEPGKAAFNKIANSYNPKRPMGQKHVDSTMMRSRWVTLRNSYPSKDYFPSLLQDDPHRDREIAQRLKYGFSFNMLGKKFDLPARDIKHHWFYSLSYKNQDVQPLSDKPFEESILKGMLLNKSTSELCALSPLFRKPYVNKLRNDFEEKYSKIFDDIRKLFPEEIAALEEGSLSLDDLFEKYFQHQQEIDPENIALNFFMEIEASLDAP